jgi:hypothetical protein
MSESKNFFAAQNPKGDGHHVSIETAESRKIHTFLKSSVDNELAPHGAGSYHDQDHHNELMRRVEKYLINDTASDE